MKALRAEAQRRFGYLELETRLNGAAEIGFPDIELPDLSARKIRLSDVDSKVVMVYFWSASDAKQNIFNTDVLKPLYGKYHQQGFEVYQVSLDPDKTHVGYRRSRIRNCLGLMSATHVRMLLHM